MEDSVIAGCWVSFGPLHNRLDLKKDSGPCMVSNRTTVKMDAA